MTTGKLARRLALAPLLGVLTTVVIAWALTLPSPQNQQIFGFGRVMEDDNNSDLFVSMVIERNYGREFILVRCDEGFNAAANHALAKLRRTYDAPEPFSMPRADWFAPLPDARTFFQWGWRISGWPFRCLRSCTFQVAGESELRLRGGMHAPSFLIFEPPTNDPHRNSLPFLPWWPGLLANTAIFAAPWALLLLAPSLLRRHLRRRRGQCPHCGYDLRNNNSPRCPECGAIARQ